eukprot:5021351-Pyramimonas_sp.AAC.1
MCIRDRGALRRLLDEGERPAGRVRTTRGGADGRRCGLPAPRREGSAAEPPAGPSVARHVPLLPRTEAA